MSENQDLKSKMDPQVALVGSELEEVPIWGTWVRRRCGQIEAGTRKGVPRGQKIPFGQKKGLAALLTTLYPRGYKTTAELGETVGVSGELIRKWRREKDFQALVQEFEIDFAQYVLSNLADKDFLLGLYNSLYEPFFWSNNILSIISFEGARAVSPADQHEKYLPFIREVMPEYSPLESPIRLPEDPDPEYPVNKWAFVDICRAAGKALNAKRSKRGVKPYDTVRYQARNVMLQFTKQHPILELRVCLNYIEEGLRAGQSKDDLLSLVEQARQIIDIAFSEKEKEEKISLDNLTMKKNELKEETD